MSDATLPGTEHAELMDRVYRRQRHVYDLTRRWYLAGRDRLIADLEPPAGGRVLEVGCGTARNLIAAARAYPQVRFYGFDISEAMLASGMGAIARAGLGDRIILARADAANFDPVATFGVAGFDRVFASYTLSMIPDWRGAAAAALAALAPGGRLHVVDFGQCEGLPHAVRRALFTWLSWFHVTPRRRLFDELGDALLPRGGTVRRAVLHRGYAWYGVAEPAGRDGGSAISSSVS
jgi:S-adenosylmethionine-diacylgycerolhomoserine-N-methlytransferase